jgi:hypothetical protein
LGKTAKTAEDTRLSDETLAETERTLQGENAVTHKIPEADNYQQVNIWFVVDYCRAQRA